MIAVEFVIARRFPLLRDFRQLLHAIPRLGIVAESGFRLPRCLYLGHDGGIGCIGQALQDGRLGVAEGRAHVLRLVEVVIVGDTYVVGEIGVLSAFLSHFGQSEGCCQGGDHYGDARRGAAVAVLGLMMSVFDALLGVLDRHGASSLA